MSISPPAVNSSAGPVTDPGDRPPPVALPAASRVNRPLGPGAGTAVAVMSVSAADPLGMLRMYGEKVLPELRG